MGVKDTAVRAAVSVIQWPTISLSGATFNNGVLEVELARSDSSKSVNLG